MVLVIAAMQRGNSGVAATAEANQPVVERSSSLHHTCKSEDEDLVMTIKTGSLGDGTRDVLLSTTRLNSEHSRRDSRKKAKRRSSCSGSVPSPAKGSPPTFNLTRGASEATKSERAAAASDREARRRSSCSGIGVPPGDESLIPISPTGSARSNKKKKKTRRTSCSGSSPARTNEPSELSRSRCAPGMTGEITRTPSKKRLVRRSSCSGRVSTQEKKTLSKSTSERCHHGPRARRRFSTGATEAVATSCPPAVPPVLLSPSRPRRKKGERKMPRRSSTSCATPRGSSRKKKMIVDCVEVAAGLEGKRSPASSSRRKLKKIHSKNGAQRVMTSDEEEDSEKNKRRRSKARRKSLTSLSSQSSGMSSLASISSTEWSLTDGLPKKNGASQHSVSSSEKSSGGRKMPRRHSTSNCSASALLRRYMHNQQPHMCLDDASSAAESNRERQAVETSGGPKTPSRHSTSNTSATALLRQYMHNQQPHMLKDDDDAESSSEMVLEAAASPRSAASGSTKSGKKKKRPSGKSQISEGLQAVKKIVAKMKESPDDVNVQRNACKELERQSQKRKNLLVILISRGNSSATSMIALLIAAMRKFAHQDEAIPIHAVNTLYNLVTAAANRSNRPVEASDDGCGTPAPSYGSGVCKEILQQGGSLALSMIILRNQGTDGNQDLLQLAQQTLQALDCASYSTAGAIADDPAPAKTTTPAPVDRAGDTRDDLAKASDHPIKRYSSLLWKGWSSRSAVKSEEDLPAEPAIVPFQIYSLTPGHIDMLLAMQLGEPESAEIRQGLCSTSCAEMPSRGDPDTSTGNLCDELIHNVMRPEADNIEMQAKCCRLIVDLTFGHETNKKTLVEAGGAAEIVSTMSRFPDQAVIQSVGLLALRNLSSVRGATQQQSLVQDGVIEASFAAIRAFSNNGFIKETACAILYNLSQSSTTPGSDSFASKYILDDVEGAKDILKRDNMTSGATSSAKYTGKLLRRLEQHQPMRRAARRSSC